MRCHTEIFRFMRTAGGTLVLELNATGQMSETSDKVSQPQAGTAAADMDPVEFTLRKRLPRKLPRRRNDVYVNMKTDFRAQLARCQKLLDAAGSGHREIYIHGLGLAISRAINIALQLQACSQGALQLAANTSTVELVDDLEPDDPDEGEVLTRTRNNSAIHIKVFYPDPK
ncbi:ribonuclease P protein subunit p20 isoform X1 [Paramormyrops kingsleyae]|uniref:Ribonuclease P protein subunit p20 n=2 Tax=Paramormyrops kingsleyae TaxID=1676925 RepID=A0A3B3Q7P3_9TELE|nr:ribonuclease P protein subunit p20 isoform X1 [Paramormyrops kingsleyae]